jgi:hypothetical protein
MLVTITQYNAFDSKFILIVLALVLKLDLNLLEGYLLSLSQYLSWT